ncbi:MAG: catalase-related domain-containing protein, partial [Hypericibacter sp.]
GALFRLMTEAQRKALMDNIAGAMQGVPEAIQRRQIEHFIKADPRYGEGVAQRLGLKGKQSAAE